MKRPRPGVAARLRRLVRFHRQGVAQNGWLGWLLYQAFVRGRWTARATGCRLWPRGSRYPVYARPGASDIRVYEQIFVEEEYRCLDGIPDPGLILDCGANVGYSSAYLLSRFPTATVVAVEPDPGNYEVLRSNVARFGARVFTVRAGVWPRAVGLKVERTGYRDEKEWSVWVRECEHGETPDVEAVDIGTLLAGSGFDRISVLKMDIERSEIYVFSDNYRDWLARCDAIVIELHDEECEAVFNRAIAGQGFRVGRCGELTVCLRPRSDAPRPVEAVWPTPPAAT